MSCSKETGVSKHCAKTWSHTKQSFNFIWMLLNGSCKIGKDFVSFSLLYLFSLKPGWKRCYLCNISKTKSKEIRSYACVRVCVCVRACECMCVSVCACVHPRVCLSVSVYAILKKGALYMYRSQVQVQGSSFGQDFPRFFLDLPSRAKPPKTYLINKSWRLFYHFDY